MEGAASASRPRARHSSHLPPLQLAVSREAKEEWMRQLAGGTADGGDMSISELSKNAPHGVKGMQLFEEFMRLQVPIVRAVWFIRLIYLSSNDRNTSNSAERSKSLLADCSKCMESIVMESSACVQVGNGVGISNAFVPSTLSDPSSPSLSSAPTTSSTTTNNTILDSTILATLQAMGLLVSDKFITCHIRLTYMLHLLLYCFHDGLLPKTKTLDWLLGSWQTALNEMMKDALFSNTVALLFVQCIVELDVFNIISAHSRIHAYRIIQLCWLWQNKV